LPQLRKRKISFPELKGSYREGKRIGCLFLGKKKKNQTLTGEKKETRKLSISSTKISGKLLRRIVIAKPPTKKRRRTGSCSILLVVERGVGERGSRSWGEGQGYDRSMREGGEGKVMLLPRGGGGMVRSESP